MEQLCLFAPQEVIRNTAEKTLMRGEFHQSERNWCELKQLDPDNDFLNTSLDICQYWNARYADDEAFKRENPLEIYRKWREFEHYMDGRQYPESILRLIKENIFLLNIGLENPTPRLRNSFSQLGITVLDMLMEIEKWHLAVQEIQTIRGNDSSYKNGTFFLKCSKVYYKAGNIDVSRRFLLRAFWDQPGVIEFTDIVDRDLLGGLYDLYPDYQTREDLVLST